MSNHTDSFIDLCLARQARPQDIDSYVEEWHEGDSDSALHDYLGMSWAEYSAWVARPDVVPHIIAAHRRGVDLAEVLEDEIAASPKP